MATCCRTLPQRHDAAKIATWPRPSLRHERHHKCRSWREEIRALQSARPIIQVVIPLFPLTLPLLLACLASGAAKTSLPHVIDLSAQDTFIKAGIGRAQQSEIAKLIERSSADWEQSRITQMRARRVSLAPGKMDGLILHSTAPEDCGATGNCLLVVLRQHGGHWQLILPEAFADGFGVSRIMHNGVYDLAISTNESADKSSLTVLTFDGTRYRSSSAP